MKKAVNETKEVSEMAHMDEMDKEMGEMAHMDEMDMEEMHHAEEGYTKEAYMDEMEDMDEVVYEIELSEDMKKKTTKTEMKFDGRKSKVVGVDSDIKKQRMGEANMDLGPEDEDG